MFHESFPFAVPQDSALASDRLRDEDAHSANARRMELEELHVLQRNAPAGQDGRAVAGVGVSVGGRAVHSSESAGGDQNGLGMKDVDVAGGQFQSHHARAHSPV